MESHPLRVRGLKHDRMIIEMKEEYVASFTGAWIETGGNLAGDYPDEGRILYGCVD